MKVTRDAAYVAELLDEIAQGRTNFRALADTVAEQLMVEPLTGQSREEADKLDAHLRMMKNEGLITYEGPSGDGLFYSVRQS